MDDVAFHDHDDELQLPDTHIDDEFDDLDSIAMYHSPLLWMTL